VRFSYGGFVDGLENGHASYPYTVKHGGRSGVVWCGNSLNRRLTHGCVQILHASAHHWGHTHNL